MTTHRLKSWPEYFEPVNQGIKPFEIRRDDRDYAVGDTLVLCEWKPETREFTGRECTCLVTCLVRGLDTGWSNGERVPLLGLRAGYIIMGLQ